MKNKNIKHIAFLLFLIVTAGFLIKGISGFTSTGDSNQTAFCDNSSNQGKQCDLNGTCGACLRTSSLTDPYTAICQTNSVPYVDLDSSCSQSLSPDIVGNPTGLGTIYYMTLSGWSTISGFSSSQGFNTHFADGGRCGIYTPPPELSRIETPTASLICKTINKSLGASQEIQKTTNCSNLSVNITKFNENTLPVKFPDPNCPDCDMIFTSQDNGLVNGSVCLNQNKKTGQISQGFTVCPAGKRNLGTVNLNLAGSGNSTAVGSASYAIKKSTSYLYIAPTINYCGYPQQVLTHTVQGNGIGIKAVSSYIDSIIREYSCNGVDKATRIAVKNSTGPVKSTGSMKINQQNISYSATITYYVTIATTCKGKPCNKTTLKTLKVNCTQQIQRNDAIQRVRDTDIVLQYIYDTFSQSMPVVKTKKFDNTFRNDLIDKFANTCCPIF